MYTPTISDEFVISGRFLPAYLLAGAAPPEDAVWLPVELRRVLDLPWTPRQCFVLRVLERWPREKCATALGIPAETVDDESYAAARLLAQLAERDPMEWRDGSTLEVGTGPPIE